jgi:hypothetical protein
MISLSLYTFIPSWLHAATVHRPSWSYVYLRTHIDINFTYSVIPIKNQLVSSLQTSTQTEIQIDDVLCYFSFPRLGVTIPLTPGNFLLVNALEYHCLSSRCQSDVDIYCVSSYLKTAIVGGNDNNRQLSEKEVECLNAFPVTKVDRKRKRP